MSCMYASVACAAGAGRTHGSFTTNTAFACAFERRRQRRHCEQAATSMNALIMRYRTGGGGGCHAPSHYGHCRRNSPEAGVVHVGSISMSCA